MTVLVTGASGFIGRALAQRLKMDGVHSVRAALRNTSRKDLPEGVEVVQTGDLVSSAVNWQDALTEVNVVIHTAARAHVINENAKDPMAAFRAINVDATLKLAEQAISAGVKRFIYLSSIKVNGEETQSGRPFTADDLPAPIDPYGVSKQEAEEGLRRLSENSGMEIVIIRPTLVYGPGVKGNFHSMMRWLAKGIPLPLASVRNQRSLVALDNLIDLIIVCTQHPAASGQTFLVGDGEDLSTPELLQRTAFALGKRARLIPAPVALLRVCAGLLGKDSAVQKLCGSLQVDIDKTREQLGWTPPVNVDDALRKTAEEFLRSER